MAPNILKPEGEPSREAMRDVLVKMCRGKIHRATVTEANLHYVGSVTLGTELLEASGILPGEAVQVVDVDNGSHLETYTIPGPPGTVCLNGPAARLVQPGDRVIVIAYGWMEEGEAQDWKPRVVFVDPENRILETAGEEEHGSVR